MARSLVCTLLSTALFLLLTHRCFGEETSHVIDADASNFDKLVLDSGKFSLVGFFAPVRYSKVPQPYTVRSYQPVRTQDLY